MEHVITVDVETFQRLKNSVNGNPRYRVTIRKPGYGTESLVTKPDSSFVLEMSAFNQGRYEISVNGRNQITNMRKI